MQGHTPPLARLIEDQPHPAWCDRADGGMCHGSPISVIDCLVLGDGNPLTDGGKPVMVKLTMQIAEAGAGPCVYLHGARLEPRDAKILAHTLALLGYAQLAATLQRLAEWADPPQNRIVDPKTGRIQLLDGAA